MAIPTLGVNAPNFTLSSDSGDSFTLSQNRGRPVVLYFYPKDNTQTCTVENLSFSALASAFKAANALLVGISPDSPADHVKFRNRHGLTPILLSDPSHEVISAYGAWGEKTRFGRTYEGVIRTTCLIDAAGSIARVWVVNRVKDHAEDVLAAVRALGAK